ncbi:SH3 domain-containing protein [Bellilinea sp.]|jgi:hypothetical protein|uniref:SH3 domain-containing protein n=1 Tax=Bellilinea sp. TaxID=2838785 RepID=UPI002ADE904A|nr:SH3 domain-containing protein [Bellilinea sp.]
MRSTKRKWFLLLFIITIIIPFGLPEGGGTRVLAQIPTVDIATVTSTPSGPIVSVRPGTNEPSINVRSGPNALYPRVGVLLIGQTAVAKGRSPGGDWILIEYPGAPGNVGWVYSPFVNITPGELPIVEPPPTPTRDMTATIDPTLAAQFIVTVAPTRLPTFTPPPPLAIPTFQNPSAAGVPAVPMGLIIVVLLTIGVLLGIFSFVQRR